MSELRVTLRPIAPGVDADLNEAPLVPRPESVVLRYDGELRVVASGTPLSDTLPREHHGSLIVAALLGQRPVSLSVRPTWNADVEPLTIDSLEGQRIHRMSQSLLLLEAAQRIAPEAEVRLAHSVGFGRRVLIGLGFKQRAEALAAQLEQEMNRLVAEALPLNESWVGPTEAMEYFQRVRWNDTVELLATWRDSSVPLASYGRVHAIVMMPLLHNTALAGGFRILADHGGLLLLFGNSERSQSQRAAVSGPPVTTMENAEPSGMLRVEPATMMHAGLRSVSNEEALAVSRQTLSMTQQQERWLETLDIKSVGAFNRACITGHVGELINVSEGFHEKRITRIADEVHGRGKSARIVCIAGPSSSGKTTFIQRLRVQLQVLGMNPIAISLDDYYCDRELTPKDNTGEYDFEALEALRLEMLQEHLGRLLRGETVKTSHYDFKAGRSATEGGASVRLNHNCVLMLEGIHGLNPGLLGPIGQHEVFRIFVCPLAQLPFDRVTRLHASDIRLIRRIVRDRHSRGYSAAETIARWESVRAGERKHIFPFQHNADAVFDTSLIYEIAVLKVFAERYLLEVPRDHRAAATAFRLLRLVDRIVPLYPDRVPPTSILREFIGGSSFQY